MEVFSNLGEQTCSVDSITRTLNQESDYRIQPRGTKGVDNGAKGELVK